MRSLLDIDVLLARLDADHADHRRAREWLAAEIDHGWASCAITENGFVRIVSHPKYPSPMSLDQAAARLAEAKQSERHAFWPCDVSLLDQALVKRSRVHGPRQVSAAVEKRVKLAV